MSSMNENENMNFTHISKHTVNWEIIPMFHMLNSVIESINTSNTS